MNREIIIAISARKKKIKLYKNIFINCIQKFKEQALKIPKFFETTFFIL